MNQRFRTGQLSRRGFLTGAGAAGAVVAGGRLIGTPPVRAINASGLRAAAVTTNPKKTVHLAGTDGWVSMPESSPANPPFFPDALAPADANTYVFGFRDVTGLDAAGVAAQRGKAQISAPMLSFDENDDITISLTNLGLLQRPDLFDGHTLHWHGFVNAIPLFDGVPELSLSVPVGRDFSYNYIAHDPGTYMYHCHFEDVEHVQMGMTGMVFLRPAQNGNTALYRSGKYAYNDGDGTTGYDREFAFMLTELWSAAHYRDAHIQVSDWTDYDPNFFLMNGRGYPDTLADNGDPLTNGPGRLQYQPISSAVHVNAGDQVLLRMSSLGYKNHTMTVDNMDLTVVARDASLLRGRDGSSNAFTSNAIDIGPGESADVIFTAPDSPGEYLLYDRNYSQTSTGEGSGGGLGGMMTKIIVHPGTLKPQTAANTWAF